MHIPDTDICKKAYDEFLTLGYEIDINQKNLKESFNISKDPKRDWFKCFKLSHHDAHERNFLDLDNMPNLKILTDYILENDSEINIKETIIFVTKDMIFKVKKGSIYPYKLFEYHPTEKIELDQKFRSLCDELAALENTRDQTRIEETYVVSKDNNGLWFRSGNISKNGSYKKNFNLDAMPCLKALSDILNKQDSIFRTNGGRIFITSTKIYRVRNSIEQVLLPISNKKPKKV